MRRFAFFALSTLLFLLAPAPGALAAAITPQDDAGSGRDAPATRVGAVPIQPGIVYSGTIEGVLLDSEDWYSFVAPAGATVEVRVSSPLGCAHLYDSAGTELTFTCTEGVVLVGRATAVVPTAGTYYVDYGYLQPHTYRFSLGVGAPAPNPAPVDDPLETGSGGMPAVAGATQAGPHTVIAVVDTGVNLYHRFFRAPGLTAHPSTWLTGFPASASTVNLSLGASSWTSATAADAATFTGMQRSAYDAGTGTFDEHLYTFPGTRVVAGISFGEYVDPLFPPIGSRPVLDDDGHGTHSAGLAGGANLASADGNVLVVAVEVGKGTFDEGMRWAARQPWIDALSISLGVLANAPVTTSPTGDRGGTEWATREAALAGKPVFVASGNGFSNTGLAPDHCTTYTSAYTGPAWVTRIGAAQPGNGSPTWWHCVPVDAVARTDVQSASSFDLTGGENASGTSAATPNAAGHFAHLLLAGRVAGSGAARDVVLDHLLHAAGPAPLAAGANDPSVYPLSLADQGYGLIDQAALDDATARLLAGTGPGPRPETEDWFAADRALRTALWGPGSATAGPGGGPVLQNDAGSGGDAPDNRAQGSVPVEPGVRHSGDTVADNSDWYSFAGTAGDTVTVNLSAAVACVALYDPAGVQVGTGNCSEAYAVQLAPLTATLGATGRWYLRVYGQTPQFYRFGFGRNGPAPPVFP